ncbi:predicted protein [Histoplasma mississippiense (nom. inval.)]|uniref:predicted protein n=1 Tax=Ajellomyces capsulatus (strain NAm1 / WU24) TaxID=2059318 RepID=UPI000157CD56|nr:predicted protein [Histoplasma mississippiense (nom. inval.)]EDN10376.1 predicted protein [Histoplasma mississippiense (nom. inval.)]
MPAVYRFLPRLFIFSSQSGVDSRLKSGWYTIIKGVLFKLPIMNLRDWLFFLEANVSRILKRRINGDTPPRNVPILNMYSATESCNRNYQRDQPFCFTRILLRLLSFRKQREMSRQTFDVYF